MKLIDLLVQELPKRGGWPECATCVAQDHDELVMFADCIPSVVRQINGRWFMNSRRLNGNGSEGYKLADDYATSVVTREQYEAALAAAQQPVWSGEGLPPVGCEFEYGTHRTKAKCLAIGHHMVFASKGDPDDEESDFEEFLIDALTEFHPLRSGADKKRDEFSRACVDFDNKISAGNSYDFFSKLYDAIASGHIYGVKADV